MGSVFCCRPYRVYLTPVSLVPRLHSGNPTDLTILTTCFWKACHVALFFDDIQEFALEQIVLSFLFLGIDR